MTAGTSGTPVTFTIRNTGSASLTGISLGEDGTNAADFTLNTAGMASALSPSNTTTFT